MTWVAVVAMATAPAAFALGVYVGYRTRPRPGEKRVISLEERRRLDAED